ncbi:MAG: long-chain fatty acid--CoA ligase [Ponticaulis sp.]|nr:long-chain fatty acid--CoA ligase [Ponticaulis sp.]|tara:strand:+ start:15475 stop:17031 length:1557 start_codon:yes stop_codon:yes gene_type:complete
MSARPTPLPATVEYWASSKPDDVAAVDGDVSLTWSQWNDAANRVANALIAADLGRDDVVVARTQIRYEWLIVRLALGKVGCKLLGLNWRLTPSETQYVLANSGAKAIFCDDADPEALLPALKGLNLQLAVSISRPAKGYEFWDDILKTSAQPEHIAKSDPPLIIYTSGTTGLPKGVEMGQHSFGDTEELRKYQKSVASRRPQLPGDVVLVTMPFNHGAGPALIRTSVRAGNKMILQRRFDGEGVLDLIDRYKVTYWNGVPTMYKRLAGLPEDVLSKYDVSSIRTISVGAAPVTQELKAWIMSYFGECLDEGYGSTETSMLTSISPDMQKVKPGSVGKPFDGVTLEIRSDDGEVLPTGEAGEIWARTPVTIRNYLNAPALPADTLDEGGFFRTGDIGQLDEDGYLYISDRVKDMIISGGVNIYPAEIEAALMRHDDVQDAAVFGIPNDEFGEEVMAVCELKPSRSATADELADHCATELSSYKRPRKIEIIQELPRNSMGKILKRTLRDPYWEGRERKV